MDTRFLESLVVVAECGSIAEAARRLSLTPAAITQRIHALENEFGVPLLTRAGRTVVVTEAAAGILDRARELLRSTRALRASLSSEELTGELRLGAVSTSVTGLLPDILVRLLGKYPLFQTFILPGTSIELYRRVLHGELDAAIMVEPDFAFPKTGQWRVLRREELVLLAPEELADRPVADLLTTEPFIRYDRNNWGGRLADRYLRENGYRPRERIELDSLEAIAVLVGRGLGVSVVPDWAPPWPRDVRLSRRSLGFPHVRTIGVFWMRNSLRLRVVEAFLAECIPAP
jgi:DNA-binding transcriptional LysR family regulator